MTIFTGIVLYILIYWVALFAVLPFGNKVPDVIGDGHATGAPENPRIRQKFLITGVVAAVLWLVVFTLIKMDVIDFYEIARKMTKEDYNE